MATTIRRNYVATDVTDHQIEALAAWWGGHTPESNSAVIREAVKRAWEAEFKARSRLKKFSKNNGDGS